MEILVCRPEKDAKGLVELLNSQNHTAISLPVIKISYKDISEEIFQYSVIVFTSKYAVESLFKQYPPELLANKKIYAVGASTANLLKEFGLSSQYPHEKYNSQELFKLIYRQNVLKDSFAIISGIGGNDFLVKELSKYTRCNKFEVYERVFEDLDYLMMKYAQSFSNKNPDLIVATSLDVFRSLIRVFAKTSAPKGAIITITSSKMLEFVSKQGFKNTLKLEEINNEYICRKILEITEASINVSNKRISPAK
ncbi:MULTISPECIES: uroporphyrinogen-III synthase [unclassified Francisella]|uniref:uroporphyrinogen-III synthase n=1 Tax=unclassified Francisella TaxID=2610885 RepID=UPI002E321629|nr:MULTISPECIES: uroporphyrinogen-III synthase [unclassified Francisella]MED7818518.1 uroporphyrinogen-III synthase [Francisella sp. 19S2-4]MED7829354.1 uroporphyrinogen-III synthase [Francisella sp. 19S2-10]